MGANKQTPCGRCGQPAWGPHCRSCSYVVKPTAARMHSSEFNRYASTVEREALACSRSWWIVAPDQFYSVAAMQNVQRLRFVNSSRTTQVNQID